MPALHRLTVASVVLLLACAATRMDAQQLPSAAQAQALLQARPDLETQLRQRVLTSGLSPEQIRTRLRAEGYPENFLDGYLGAASGTPTAANEDVLAAFQRLGITSDDDQVLRTMLRTPRDSSTRVALTGPLVRDDSASSLARDSLAFRLFGMETFLNATSEFLPTLDGPMDQNYRLGPGDQIVLILTGEVELAHTLDVAREGFVVIPQVGQLAVAGLSMAQLENLLYARLARSYSGVRRGADAPTRFSVSVTKLRAIQVFVTGAVARPASYRISSAATAMTALYAAGGPTEIGSLRTISVRRGGRVIATLDAYDYLLRGDNSTDPRLENGDIVFVGPHGPRVRITGEVVRPATYELRPGEGVSDILRAAGGFRPTALTSRLQLTRIVPNATAGQERIAVDVSVPGGRIDDIAPLSLQGGDEIRVLPIGDRVRRRVEVDGHVWTPGPQGFRPGMTLADVLRAAGGTKPDAYLGQVAISRLQSDSTRIQLRAALRDTSGATIGEIALAEDDRITVYSLTEFRPDRYVVIGGSVRRGGRFPYRDGMTLRDLVLMAGGLREGAYLREAEIARRPARWTGGVTANTLRVPIDSSYLGTAADRPARDETLVAFDHVLIMQEPDYSAPRSVVLSGEVRFPGRYGLRSKTERLSDVVVRAGGLTPAAEADAAYFARRIALTSFSADTSADSLAVERARVGVDLPKALRRPGSTDDLILFDEDSLHVPVRLSTVKVEGAVNAPTTITAEPRASLNFYIRSAGGASLSGDERRAYVIQPNGKIETKRRVAFLIPITPTPRPGSTVVIPARSSDSRAQERIAVAGLVTQMIASIATAYALLR